MWLTGPTSYKCLTSKDSPSCRSPKGIKLPRWSSDLKTSHVRTPACGLLKRKPQLSCVHGGTSCSYCTCSRDGKTTFSGRLWCSALVLLRTELLYPNRARDRVPSVPVYSFTGHLVCHSGHPRTKSFLDGPSTRKRVTLTHQPVVS